MSFKYESLKSHIVHISRCECREEVWQPQCVAPIEILSGIAIR
ncbi:MAG: hypothetical protein ACFE8N_07630 [Promethearchaeota archaeon]